jgi:hypothetical protein
MLTTNRAADSRTAQDSAKNLPRTAAFGRKAIASFIAARDGVPLLTVYEKRFPYARRDLELFIKANEVPAGSTTGTTWGHELDADGSDAQFLQAVRYREILGNLPGVLDVSAKTKLSAADALFAAEVVGDGLPIPLSPANYDDVTVQPIKVAGLAVITNSLAQRSNAEQIVGNGLRDAVVKATDTALLSSQSYGLLNGVSAAGTGASDIDEIDFQLHALLTGMTGADMASTVLVCNPATAIALSLVRDVAGSPAYPGVTVDGGVLAGLPLLVSAGAAAQTLYAIDGSAIARADVALEIAVAKSATLEMSSAPTGEVITPASASQNSVNLFQADARAVRVVRVVGWSLRRSNAVGFLSSFAPSSAITTA